MKRSLRLIPAIMLVAAPAAAQEFIFNPVMDPTAAMAYATIGVAGEQARRYYGVRGAGAPAGAPRGGDIQAFARPAPAGAVQGMAYPAPSAQFRKQQVADLLARASKTDPQSAAALRAQFSKSDYAPVYDGITRPYGLAGNDAASSLAAYMVLGWMIVHDGQEPSRAGLQGVRAQAAQALSDPRLSAPGMRARLGEEFKILFVTVHAGWQSARREGTLDRYADGVAQLFGQKNGMNLRAARIGPHGFEGG